MKLVFHGIFVLSRPVLFCFVLLCQTQYEIDNHKWMDVNEWCLSNVDIEIGFDELSVTD